MAPPIMEAWSPCYNMQIIRPLGFKIDIACAIIQQNNTTPPTQLLNMQSLCREIEVIEQFHPSKSKEKKKYMKIEGEI